MQKGLIIVFSLILVGFPLLGAENTQDALSACGKFSRALELLVDENINQALVLMKEIVKEYPETPEAVKAQQYIDKYALRLDHSGIVSFYLGNIATASWTLSSIPLLFDSDNSIVIGSAGLAGVGGGIFSSWLMTRNQNMSLGQDLWIEFIEASSMANFQYAYSILGKYIQDPSLRVKLNIGGQTLTALVSRGGAYYSLLEKNPSSGRIFTMINTYAWAQFYLWITLTEILNSENDDINNALAAVLPDLAVLGSYYLWEKGGWSFQRAGIVSVSGIAGMLTGIFTNMIIDAAGVNPTSALTSSITIGFSLAGEVAGAFLTAGMEPDRKSDKSLLSNLSFSPVAGPDGAGVMVGMRY